MYHILCRFQEQNFQVNHDLLVEKLKLKAVQNFFDLMTRRYMLAKRFS